MNYFDMTNDQMLEWGKAESALRISDLSVRTAEGLRAAQANAETRRKAIGATKGQAADMVIIANREARRKTEAAQPAAQEPGDLREFLDKMVRAELIKWAREQPTIKALWLRYVLDAAQPAAQEPDELLREWIAAIGVNPELNRWHVSREDVLQLIRAARGS